MNYRADAPSCIDCQAIDCVVNVEVGPLSVVFGDSAPGHRFRYREVLGKFLCQSAGLPPNVRIRVTMSKEEAEEEIESGGEVIPLKRLECLVLRLDTPKGGNCSSFH